MKMGGGEVWDFVVKGEHDFWIVDRSGCWVWLFDKRCFTLSFFCSGERSGRGRKVLVVGWIVDGDFGFMSGKVSFPFLCLSGGKEEGKRIIERREEWREREEHFGCQFFVQGGLRES